ncbi:hypothetical protein [Pusillimonas sp. T2]|uniref:hypothetical protein n=1 Tax=Pusillimonas sp. T2 TaxID=1548123 RepID=UPI001179F612|nr:hypothetical protein [Pusillimonas sp. T2]
MKAKEQEINVKDTVQDVVEDLGMISPVLCPNYLSRRQGCLIGSLVFGGLVGIGFAAAVIEDTGHWIFLLVGLLPLILVLVATALAIGSVKMIHLPFYLLISMLVIAAIAGMGAYLSNTPGILWMAGLGYFMLLIITFLFAIAFARNLFEALLWPKFRPQAVERVQQSAALDEATKAKVLSLLGDRVPNSIALNRVLQGKISTI